LILQDKKKSGGDKSEEYGGGKWWFDSGITFAKNCFIDSAGWGLALSRKRNQPPLSWNGGLTQQILWTKRDNASTLIFLIHHLTWWNKFFVNDSLTVEECDHCHFVLTSEIEIFCVLESVASAIPCSVFLFGDHTGNTRFQHFFVTAESSKEWSSSAGWINSWQACSLRAYCSSVKQCGTNLVKIFRFLRSYMKILWIFF
jgi:hypothetical protein